MHSILFLWLSGVSFAGDATATSAELEHLQALVERLIPIVEEQAGRKFYHVPELVLANREIMKGVVYDEQIHLLRNLDQLAEEDAEIAAMYTSANLSTALVGKYGFLDKKLYVVSDGIREALARRGVREELVEPVIAIVVAHELTHALQDQHSDLNDIVSSRIDADAVMAVNCLVEGHAVWVHERVGDALGYTEAVEVFGEILGYRTGNGGISSDPGSFYSSYVYGQGRAFVAYHAKASGIETTWRILMSPPGSTAMIVAPERYNPLVAPAWKKEVRAAVATARMKITPPSWKPVDDGIGDYNLRQDLVEAGNSHAIADHWTAGWSSSAVKHPTKWAEVELLAFESDEYAQMYVEHMRAHAELTLAMVTPTLTSAFVPNVHGDVSNYTDVEADEGAHEHLTMQFDLGPTHEVHNFWVARDAFVVQVRVVNHRVSERKIASAIQRVFKSLD